MLCRPVPVPSGAIGGYDFETLAKIRERIRVVFGRETTFDDSYLARRYSLSESGELVLILR